MAKGGKLKTALQDLKGVNHRLEKQKKLRKVAEKRKRSAVEVQEEEKLAFNIAQIDDTDSSEEDDQEDKVEDEDEELDLDGTNGVKLDATEDDEVEDENDEEDEDAENNAEDDDEDDEEEEDIPYSDIASLDSEDRGDVVPYQRLTINNQAALSTSLSRIALPLSSIPFSAHQSITSATPTSIPDIDDDLNRELAFYAQALSAVKSARKQLKSEGAPFARPADYFAEMVKSEEHMGRVKQRLVDDAAAKKASSEAKRQRDLKKFGKAVQVAKLQERDKAKKDTMEKISNMKRSELKYKDPLNIFADQFHRTFKCIADAGE